MVYKSYSIEQKIKFLDLRKNNVSVSAAARAVGAVRGTAKTWIAKEKKLRLEYERFLENPQMPEEQEDYKLQSRIPLEEKIRCIQAIEAGLPLNQAAIELGCSLSSVRSWYKAKDGLMALYYMREEKNDQEAPEQNHKDELSLNTALLEGALMSKDSKDINLAETIKAQNKEIEFLKHRVAYLESLNEILKDRHGPVKKKKSLKPSDEQVLEEEKT